MYVHHGINPDFRCFVPEINNMNIHAKSIEAALFL